MRSHVLIDEQLPDFDATSIRHAVVPVPCSAAYEAVVRADFARTARRDPAVRALFALRGLPERALEVVGRRPPQSPPEEMRLADMPTEGEWVRLAEDPGREIVFGAIGRFWGPRIRWEHIRAEDFRGFRAPGYARIAANFSLREYGPARCLVSYEARTQATDPASRSRFARYWRIVGPFAGLVLGRQLAAIRNEARSMGAR